MAVGTQISERKRTLILINIIITCVATTLLMTALSTALPAIDRELGIESSQGQWLISVYSLVMGIVMPLTAFLIRRIPTKVLYVGAIGIVAVGLVIALCSVSFPMLIVGRVFQACGNGILMSMSQVILLSIYPPEKRGLAMGWYGLAVGAAPVVAPTLGGILVDLIGWRAIFGMTLIVVVIALVMAICVFENVLDTAAEKLDILSFVVSIFAFGGITLGVGNLANYGISNISVWLSLIVGVVAAVIFVYRQLHLERPFLNLRILKSAKYDIALIASMLLYLILMGASVLMPLYVQDVRGFSATISGIVLLPGALANAIVSPFAGRIYDKAGIKKLFISGAVLVFIGSIIMGFINLQTPIWVSSVCYVIRSVAFGFLLMTLVTWGTAHVEKEAVADATALLSSLRTIAGAIGSAVFAGIMSVAASASKAEGSEAQMHGVNVAFLCMT
ncbi:MAG: DHA2 family efflux MFS transporter permease subunit, partial [Clostridiales bacterium]|nr:DHA2 family efflux MFS transporter permease subunit [Clostridiales bacterium]